MRIVRYTYRIDQHTHLLYVDEDYDSSRFPPKIREKITKNERSKSYEATISDLGEMGEVEFKKKGYLEIPSVILSESEA